MNQDVPHPVTATRSPGTGSKLVRLGASPAARSQQAGCEATSASMLPAPAPARTPSPAGSPSRIVLSLNSWPPSRDVVPQARRPAPRWLREARGIRGRPPDQQSLAAGTQVVPKARQQALRRLGLRRAGGALASTVRRSARRLRRAAVGRR